MKTSGIFTLHQGKIPVRSGESFKLIPFGDVHRDAPLHCRRSWNDFLAYGEHHAKNAWFLGLGDYTDGVSTSERKILAQGLHESTVATIEDKYKGVVKTLANELSFMKGRILGMVGGNHFYPYRNGSTSDHELCGALNTRFLGVCSFIRLSLVLEGHQRKTATLDVFVHHGAGGGTTPGATFNTLEKMQQTADADIYLMGHDHKKGAIPSAPRLKILQTSSGIKLKERTPWLGRTGSFLKAYEDGEMSYNVDSARSPCALGWIEFDITVTRVRDDGQDFLEVKIRGTT